ncbi:MAG: tRNA 5-methoxyuridine(34)/uridine 5-oxyacetic acid(34) synthase CmoB [Desulfobulbus sp.]|jgi:tRNA (mo5U34)-methyltransferase|uniref:tRNA 5-methoxyuridine(34)/uridine 5-oxyacetic acid(34) synthase CmoB n=1 Tax=Desulfobulbus sp. TaxID=895 RepID=UPI00284B0D4C|nr:tRNA 5-methoxyuridine(34)/uridine 5-oxyacetic acid(34) synthase CmoB [Desulfobulbus sp.]MDR2550607.1 tRNA 5-methoxyuridine(34)/uridine 5-oxyacetic acid(34) synthase CmoB [Desulfobulbus sp.]
MDLVQAFPQADGARLGSVLAEKAAWINQDKKGFLRYRNLLAEVGHLRASSCDFSGDAVRIGTAGDLSPDQQLQVHQVLRGFMPWRKGPFSVFGIDIDAEWRSERKWNRILPELPDLAGKTVADIGCNNGYYMFRMVHHRPALVLGFEPYVQHYYTFNTLNAFAGQRHLRVELLGIEHLPLFPACFDVIFCLGILYHRPSPLDALHDLHTALKPGGWLIVESQAIPGEEPVALFPRTTYAKVPGTWFVPTGACLFNWIARTGFREVRLFCDHPMSSAEQRRTAWMDFESYEDFIDKDNRQLTVEGYSAPRRVFLKATK